MREILEQPYRRKSRGRLRFVIELSRPLFRSVKALPRRLFNLLHEVRENAAPSASRIIRVERGVAPSSSSALAVYAHYSPSGRVSDMVLRQLHEYAQQGFRIAFVSNAPHLEEEAWRAVADIAEIIVHRRNVARDFGAWSDILAEYYPETTELEEILLVNDSVLGPIRPLGAVFDRLRSSGDGVFGLTEAVQFRAHLQSYFILLRGTSAIRDLRIFLRTRWLTNRKNALIRNFEIGLTKAMQASGHLVAAVWSYEQLEELLVAHPEECAPILATFGPVSRLRASRHAKDPLALRRLLLNFPLNPTHHFAGLLLRRTAFPFLKTEFVRDNPLKAPEALYWRSILPPGSVTSTEILEDHLSQYGYARGKTPRPRPMSSPGSETALPPIIMPASIGLQLRMARNTPERILFSIIVPVFRPPLDVFEAMLRSVSVQTYSRWQLCLAIVDTGPESSELIAFAQHAQRNDPRISVRILESNGGIARNSNNALELANGNWIVLLDHDDLLTPDALSVIARAIEETPDTVFVYSDKDMIDRAGRNTSNALRKPAWSPDMMLNANYLTHICAIPTQRVREIGGWDPDTDGAQDWDLFLRAIPQGGRVSHVPRILYHWRRIETSVSVGGLAAKPYALNGQIATLKKYLPLAGWPKAIPQHDGSMIRIDWGGAPTELVTLIVLGGSPNKKLREAAEYLGIEIIAVDGTDPALVVDEAIRCCKGECILLVDADFAPRDKFALGELIGPLANQAIAVVGGQVLDPKERILDFGVFFENGAAHPAFRGEMRHYNGEAGSCLWYRNVSATAGGAMAFRRESWHEVRGFSGIGAGQRRDLAFCLRLLGRGRILLNPYACFESLKGLPSRFELAAFNSGIDAVIVRQTLPRGDRFLNPHLDAARKSGAPRPRNIDLLPAADGPQSSAEAFYSASAYNTSDAEVAQSISRCMTWPGGPLRRVLWVLPNFTTPYYGGIHTILRTADHMLSEHGILQSFAFQGIEDTQGIAARIARAFPKLAASAQMIGIGQGDIPEGIGVVDAAICTLWTTAYPLLRFAGARRKFYFVQDWEPDFYPAGAISCLAEATYRFGYHALCNTPSLAQAYRRLGGSADVFLPAVDMAIFNAVGRTPRKASEPFRLFCYARPGTPRNCFEAIAAALIDLKKQHGGALQIVTAGQSWDAARWGLDGIVENLGLLDYHETAKLYRAVDAGLVAMATRHPSYLPLELMACGAAVIANRNINTTWLLRDRENSILSEITRSGLAEAVTLLIETPELRDRLVEGGLRTISKDHASWASNLEEIVQAIRRKAEF